MVVMESRVLYRRCCAADASCVFEALDRDIRGILEPWQVAVGMTMLCCDSRDDRMRAVFQVRLVAESVSALSK